MQENHTGRDKQRSENMRSTMTPMNWAVKRFLPVLLITVGVAVGLAFLRASQVFLIGLQGMFAGGLIGWLAGRLGRRDSGVYWTFPQRCWLGVSMMLIYVVTHLVTLSILNAGPVDTPLYWLGEVVQGFQEEGFASAGRFQSYQGKIESGWWVFMNALDAGLFWFLFIAFCVMGVCPDRNPAATDASQSGQALPERDVDSGEAYGDPGATLQPGSKAAFYAMVFVLAGLGVAGVLYRQFMNAPQSRMTYSEELAALTQYEGQWRFKEGRRLLPDDADARSFTIMPLGFGSLSLKGDTGNFTLSLNQDGRAFSGLLFMMRESGGMGQFSARIKFAPDGNSLTMSVTNFEIGGRRDIVLEAKKIVTEP
ncbi:MAG: hypothetical protein K9N55_13920 [Phycisphaerae bacterium]|nr:hypothetical protein [Phycisphaerae bacterium]